MKIGIGLIQMTFGSSTCVILLILQGNPLEIRLRS